MAASRRADAQNRFSGFDLIIAFTRPFNFGGTTKRSFFNPEPGGCPWRRSALRRLGTGLRLGVGRVPRQFFSMPSRASIFVLFLLLLVFD